MSYTHNSWPPQKRPRCMGRSNPPNYQLHKVQFNCSIARLRRSGHIHCVGWTAHHIGIIYEPTVTLSDEPRHCWWFELVRRGGRLEGWRQVTEQYTYILEHDKPHAITNGRHCVHHPQNSVLLVKSVNGGRLPAHTKSKRPFFCGAMSPAEEHGYTQKDS